MIRTMIWFIWFWVSLIFTIPFLLWVKILEKQGKEQERIKIVHKVTSLWARLVINLSGAKVTVEGAENLPEGPVVFIGNHQGNFDIPILISFIDKPKAFIAKIETSRLPFVASWMRQMRCVFMDRKDIRQSITAINQGAEYLKQGYSMVIFPEGTRSGSKEMGEFKAGSFKLATKGNVPIVPVAINGSYNIMGKKSLIIKPADVKVTILKPIETSNLSKEEVKGLHDKVCEQIGAVINKK
ncbi:1-acyl-sn-glycerol-3-phosphate acyltransferase [Clostridium swellfunianum]|uniref:lysophospholipid acyltransferase family protein n=1 Tax=Clostridium swellfunianum TaxID=1367462 RepID=UPI00202E1E8A|nr:lysophospholipid acyltransferase family protein [Clostridium swellfunianum]MCM0650337.1 1-acyl-sn-glycerol-3-phosphate acyltransferase [Clostridium swellfunianum]